MSLEAVSWGQRAQLLGKALHSGARGRQHCNCGTIPARTSDLLMFLVRPPPRSRTKPTCSSGIRCLLKEEVVPPIPSQPPCPEGQDATAPVNAGESKPHGHSASRSGQRKYAGSPGRQVWVREGVQLPDQPLPSKKRPVAGKKDVFKDVFKERFGPLGSEPGAHLQRALAILRTERDEGAVVDMLGCLSARNKGLVVTLFTTLVKERQVEPSLQVLRFIATTPGYKDLVRTYNMALKLLADIGKLARADALFERMKEQGVGANEVTFNILIAAYAKRGLVRDAENLFRAMRSEGLSPDAYTYSALVHVYTKQGQAEGAEKVLQDMLQQGVLPNEHVYSALITAYARTGDVTKAEATFAGMQQVGCAPNVYTYSAMIDVYAKQGLVREAEETFRSMLRAGHEPNVVTYSSMIAAYAKGGQVGPAEKMMQAMQEAEQAPNLVTFCSIMEAYASQNRLDDVEAIFNFVTAAGLKPNVHMYTILITAFGKAEEVAKAIQYWKLMRKAGCPRDQVAYMSMIELYRKIDRPKRVQKLELEMALKDTDDELFADEDFYDSDDQTLV